ncbi:MAG: hypothetical protein RSE22_07285 [Mucinivorans sp.]
MKKIFLLSLIALLTLGAFAGPSTAKLRQTVTTTIDTIMVDMPAADRTSDSVISAQLCEVKQMVQTRTDDINREIGKIKNKLNDNGRAGNFIIALLRNTLPFVPFVAIIFIAFFWLQYVYKRRVMRQDLIIRYIDRGETVPEWLAQSIVTTPIVDSATDQYASPNGGRPRSASAKVFLIFTIVLAFISVVWSFVLFNINGLYDRILCAVILLCVGYATVWCLQQFVKRSR